MIEMIETSIKDILSFFKYSLFDFLAQAFHYPYKLKDIKDLQSKAREIEELVKSFCDPQLVESFENFKKYLDSIDNIDKLTEVEIQFVELDKPYNSHLSLYETINRFGYYDVVTAGKLINLYASVGIKPKEEPDLLSTELGFLAFLYFGKAIGQDTSQLISTFVEEHINKWVPKLIENLKQTKYEYFVLLSDLLEKSLRCIKGEG